MLQNRLRPLQSLQPTFDGELNMSTTAIRVFRMQLIIHRNRRQIRILNIERRPRTFISSKSSKFSLEQRLALLNRFHLILPHRLRLRIEFPSEFLGNFRQECLPPNHEILLKIRVVISQSHMENPLGSEFLELLIHLLADFIEMLISLISESKHGEPYSRQITIARIQIFD
ncbi:hypothetical protein GCK72_008533 [Caenorhabditis remanei]|uniref:Uncharacterized protein n=1 Tax=Caenorhabditis remanei TaxID=31234 RepID=A0A6A5H0J4_CAERE|nr:hypothetical protein GCK72_008533 [Caenorhabditis remanei]KAF1760286.1 hypothetical protein GCK72_008533 [Caenorhabditis remanei]